MKKITLTLFFFTILSFSSYAETTSYGFSVNVPSQYKIYKSLNLGAMLKQHKGDNMDKNYSQKELRNLGVDVDETRLDYFVNTKYDVRYNNINLNVGKGEKINTPQLTSNDLVEFCSYMKSFYRNSFKNSNLRQYSCAKSNDLNTLSVKLVHDGPHSKSFENRMVQYMFDSRYGLVAFTMGCQLRYCNEMQQDLVYIANSVR